jgi:hypothetical protein
MRFESGKQQRVQSTRKCIVFAESQEKAVYKITTSCMITAPLSMSCSCKCRVQSQCPQIVHRTNNRRKRDYSWVPKVSVPKNINVNVIMTIMTGMHICSHQAQSHPAHFIFPLVLQT